jgi:hypothetical protein
MLHVSEETAEDFDIECEDKGREQKQCVEGHRNVQDVLKEVDS